MKLIDPASVGINGDQLLAVGEHLQKRYIEPGRIPGCLTLVARQGHPCYLDVSGQRDLERGTAITRDTIFRIYSMSKPITSIALMTLYEKGLFSLSDPVHRYIPSWKKLRVRTGGSYPLFQSVPCERHMTIGDLLMHTSGLTYDFHYSTNLDYAYRKLKLGRMHGDYCLQDMIDQLAELPLEFSPGTRWNYSVSTDVLGYLIEVISGKSLPDFFEETIFRPLGMPDTSFEISPDKVSRFASCYERDISKKVVRNDDGQNSRFENIKFYSGGGGLLSTIDDYYRFCQMLLNGGSLDGERVIGSRTLQFMTQNHLPGGVDLSQYALGSFSETVYDGVGFGLGFANKMNVVRNGYPTSEGSYFWGGLANTLFWVDPVEELIVIFMTQLMPSGVFNFRGQLESIIYAAIDSQ